LKFESSHKNTKSYDYFGIFKDYMKCLIVLSTDPFLY